MAFRPVLGGWPLRLYSIDAPAGLKGMPTDTNSRYLQTFRNKYLTLYPEIITFVLSLW